MKILALVLLFIAAAPTTTSLREYQLQCVTLKEIFQCVKHLNNTLEDKVKKMMVPRAVTREHCTHENFCKAATVLENLSAKTLGLEEKNWLLPRLFVVYTRNIQCKSPAPDHQIQLQELLQNIHDCALKRLLGREVIRLDASASVLSTQPAAVFNQSTHRALDSAVTPPDQTRVLPEPTEQPLHLLSSPMQSHSVSTTRRPHTLGHTPQNFPPHSQDSLPLKDRPRPFCLRLEYLG